MTPDLIAAYELMVRRIRHYNAADEEHRRLSGLLKQSEKAMDEAIEAWDNISNDYILGIDKAGDEAGWDEYQDEGVEY